MPYSNNEYISGEKIQLLCSHFLGTERDFKYNPKIGKLYHSNNDPNKFILLNDSNNTPVDNQSLVFAYTHMLRRNLQDLISHLKRFKNPFALVFHNSDDHFHPMHLNLFEEVPLIQHIFSQNCLVYNHEKVTHLPIGIANSQWRHGDISLVHKESLNKSSKEKLIYFNFSTRTNKNIRNHCKSTLESKGLSMSSNLPYPAFLKDLHSHQFCACPRGRGIDTHRLWECFYLKVVPICMADDFYKHLSKSFPIYLISDWRDLNFDDLDYANFDFGNKKLFSFKCLKNKINSFKKS